MFSNLIKLQLGVFLAPTRWRPCCFQYPTSKESNSFCIRWCKINSDDLGCSITQVPLKATVARQSNATLARFVDNITISKQDSQNTLGGIRKIFSQNQTNKNSSYLETIMLASETQSISSMPLGLALLLPVLPREVATHVEHWTPSQWIKPLGSPRSIATSAALRWEKRQRNMRCKFLFIKSGN